MAKVASATSGVLLANWVWGKKAIFEDILISSADEPTPPTQPLVPPQTHQVAQAAFPRGNRYLQLRDTLGTLWDDALFADPFPPRRQAAQAPWQLALLTLRQFAENLSDRQAADAVRSRLDWK